MTTKHRPVWEARRAHNVALLEQPALAREASVGRNAIYTNHRPIVEELRHVTMQDSQSPRGSAKNRLDELRALIDVMKVAERRMITENAALLKRALDAEAEAARHHKHNARLIVERDTALRPVRIAPKRG